MLDIKVIRDQTDLVRDAIRQKGAGQLSVVEDILKADQDRRELLRTLQQLQSETNAVSKEIGVLMKDGRKEEADQKIRMTAASKDRIRDLEEDVREVERALGALLLEVPNLPHESVPRGKTPAENEVVFESEPLPTFAFPALPHWDLTDRHGLVDFERGSKVSGAGFPFYVGAGARLHRALIAFFLDLAVKKGRYVEIQAPLVVNADSATGTGQLPDKEDMMYEVVRDGLYLIPTAEVPVTNVHRDEILDADSLPIKYCAYTPCFRREAGSYGKDVRGLNRLHQFDKVELVQFVEPDKSYDALEAMREDAERCLTRLGLPYRRLLMCTGDMGFTQAKKYDLEVWSAGQERWLEVSSISNFESFQARRMQIRYRAGKDRHVEYVHTLNGSALALPRVVSALLENGQQADGSIVIPEALAPYAGFDQIPA